MYDIVDVKADGSCFYRAIYNGAKYSYLLNDILKCIFPNIAISKYINDEDLFVKDIRKLLHNRILESKDFNIIHKVFKVLSTDEDIIYKAKLEAFPSWFIHLFPTKPTNENIFRQKISKGILKNNNWG